MYPVSGRSQHIPHSTHAGDVGPSPEAQNTRRDMWGKGALRLLAAAMAVAFVASSAGSAWTVRTPAFHANVDPSLRAGEIALVHTTAGNAGALSSRLTRAGAVDVETEAAADTVIARLSGDALATIASDPTVTVATRDLRIFATGGGNDRSGFEKDDQGDRRAGDVRNTNVSLAAINGPRAQQKTVGEDITVAVMDTGIAEHPDLPKNKVRARVDFVNDGRTGDAAGHGTFIAGLIAANGQLKGIAPDADLVSLRVLDANGTGTALGVVRAFNWLLSHRTQFNIRVLNISWGAPQTTSYQNDLLSALVESAWFSGVTVVVAAGNEGPAPHTVTSPGSDPFVITVGSFGDQGTADLGDDRESTFSSRGPTLVDGFAKPDTLAPGEHVLGLRVGGLTYTGADGSTIGSPTDRYIHMTGTSASAAFVSGVAALVLSAHPRYTPTQVKGAVVASGRVIADSVTTAVDAATALSAMTNVNVGIAPSRVLLQQLAKLRLLKGKGVTWDGVTWEGVTWDGVTWEGVTWDGVTWESVSWESVTWESVSWESVTWEGVTWERVMQ